MLYGNGKIGEQRAPRKNRIILSLFSFSCVSFALLCYYCQCCSCISLLSFSLGYICLSVWCFFESSSFLWTFVELSLVLCFVLLLPIYGETISTYILKERKQMLIYQSLKIVKWIKQEYSFILPIDLSIISLLFFFRFLQINPWWNKNDYNNNWTTITNK
jgi:hypothetical protein